ncbi:MAG: hypothetical protein ACR2M6_02600 [Vampirovibrionia bacterium]
MPLTVDRPDYTAAQLNSVWSNLISTLSPRLPYSIRVNSSGASIDDLDLSESDAEASFVTAPFDVMVALARKGQANGEGLWNAVYDQEVSKFRLDVRETVTINRILQDIISYPTVEEPSRFAYVYLDEVSGGSFEYSSDKETNIIPTSNGWNRDNLFSQENFGGLGYTEWGVGDSGLFGLIEDFEDDFNKGFTYFNTGDSYINGSTETFDVGAWPEGITPSDGESLYKTEDISSQVNGIRTMFTVPAYNTSENINLRVYYNGQRLTTGIDIIISTATTFRMTFAPINGSELVVDYKPQ